MAGEKKKILVIEDDPDILDVVKMILHSEGFEVDDDQTGEKIITSDFHPPDLFIVDGHLPKHNGVEICHHLKSDPLTKDIPIVFMSASRTLVNKVRSEGLAEVVDKPFDNTTLLKTIRESLQKTP
jgi:DNA-binding response OmpR family regulator